MQGVLRVEGWTELSWSPKVQKSPMELDSKNGDSSEKVRSGC